MTKSSPERRLRLITGGRDGSLFSAFGQKLDATTGQPQAQPQAQPHNQLGSQTVVFRDQHGNTMATARVGTSLDREPSPDDQLPMDMTVSIGSCDVVIPIVADLTTSALAQADGDHGESFAARLSENKTQE